MEKRNSAVDLAKFAASIFVVAIHVNLFVDVDETLNFLTVQIICRLAVPFFAMSTGYFLCKKLTFSKRLEKSEHNTKVFLRQWIKLILLYGVWTFVYAVYCIPWWIEIGWFSPFAFVDYAVGAVTKGSHYHFWYMQIMIIVFPIFYIILRTIEKKHLLQFAGGIWLLRMMSCTYAIFLPDVLTFELPEIIEKVLRIVPLLLIGSVIALEKQKDRKICIIGFAVSFLCLIAETFFLKKAGQEAVSYILFTLPTGYFLMRILLDTKTCIPEKICSKLGEISIFVYCVHPIFLETTADFFNSSIWHFLFVASASVLTGLVFLFIKEKIKRKKAKKCFS